MNVSDGFIRRLPKAELHIHIEGSFEPDLMFEIARRNGVRTPFDSVEAVRAAYEFEYLQALRSPASATTLDSSCGPFAGTSNNPGIGQPV